MLLVISLENHTGLQVFELICMIYDCEKMLLERASSVRSDSVSGTRHPPSAPA